MEQQRNIHEIAVTWRGKKFVVEMNLGATLEELGHKLQKLTDVKADTMRLIVQLHKSSKLLSPFSNEHARLTLLETSIVEGKSIRMMGVPKDELDQVLKNAKTDMRIAGFDVEEKRQRMRVSNGLCTSLKLPQGNYIFYDFRTLNLPGIELNPPPSEALRLMRTLAADPGIVAIMNKHRWRVGIMTEMAPEGYVGVSPVCLLGLNKNQGEEISLRLRTDDLKGFRKYQSIKKTLLHELAHMVHSERNANFYALEKQLRQEAANLDWTRSRSHILSGAKQSPQFEEYTSYNNSSSHKLGGSTSADKLANARASSVAAAYQRLANASINVTRLSEEPDSNSSGHSSHHEPHSMGDVGNELETVNINQDQQNENHEPDPDFYEHSQNEFEPEPDISIGGEAMESDSLRDSNGSRITAEPDPDLEVLRKDLDEPDPDVLRADQDSKSDGILRPDDQSDSNAFEKMENEKQVDMNCKEPDPDDFHVDETMHVEPDPDDSVLRDQEMLIPQTTEPDPDDQELQRIQDPVMVVCNRLQKAVEMLRSEVNPSEAVTVIQTLFKIIKNVIEHPDEMKFRKIRMANPVIQKNIASYKATMEILFLIGFIEDVVQDEIGKAEAYLVLKRNDPGLLWLAKSSLETCIAF